MAYCDSSKTINNCKECRVWGGPFREWQESIFGKLNKIHHQILWCYDREKVISLLGEEIAYINKAIEELKNCKPGQ